MSASLSLIGVKVVSWDVDGTLYAVGALRRAIFGRMVAAWLRGQGPRAWRGLQAWRRARARLEAWRGGHPSGDPVPAVEVAARAIFEAELMVPALASVGPSPGVGALLELVAGWGIVQVVFSDYEAEAKLRALGLSRHFAACYAGESLGVPKPSPEGLRRIARDLQVSPAQILHIGDRADTDGAAAADFGCRSLVRGRDFRDFAALRTSLSR